MAFEFKFFDKVSSILELELPEGDTMDQHLNAIIPKIMPWSEDLNEPQFYLDTRWKEIRDDDNFHESVLHIFREGGEYLVSVDGNIIKGVWRILPESSTLILEVGGKGELYDRSFLNGDFFILSKHGDQTRKGNRKYFVLAREARVQNLEWRDIMELLFNMYRSNNQYMIAAVIAVVIIAIVLVFSLL